MADSPEVLDTQLTLSAGATIAVNTGGAFSECIINRFWAKVDKNGPMSCLGTQCWVWTAARRSGYGVFTIRKPRLVCAHRFSYWLHFGSIDGQVDHRCHNRSCVRPDHLRPVTNKQNHENLRGANKNSASGIRGVFWHQGRWQTVVTHNGRQYYAGRFTTLEEAEEAVKQKRRELFTHSDMDIDQ